MSTMPRDQLHLDRYEKQWLYMITIALGVFFASLLAGAIIFGVQPAGAGGFVNPQKLNETMFAQPGVRHVGGNRYEVVLLAQAWFFNPALITLPEGADVTFYVTSSDITHGFMIEHHNVNFEVVPGHIARAQVKFNRVGEFKILCHEYCGTGHHIMHATIRVEANPEA
ncbi:MAG UNVERIFIED_CONTAM: cytochrome c oxidase subunit II [Anaerolineae bacterium]